MQSTSYFTLLSNIGVCGSNTHDSCVSIDRTILQFDISGINSLNRNVPIGLSLRDRVRSSVIREGLRVEPLLLHVERGQLRWLGHLVRMPPGCLPGEVFRARPTGRRKTQDMLEGLCLSAGLGTPWDSSGGAGRSDWGEGSLGLPSEAATPATRPRISRRR
ncbi:hypothetical protein CCH79_00008546 [Gambusia affinis]|uniref:Uncharacterized protein n=1 Tax=Gambusia affinis TaxID=33528 RepID=A0A315UUV7_GAMAF|nr:hypothetical protein CCH79_00008546 [Gambusia affinis]